MIVAVLVGAASIVSSGCTSAGAQSDASTAATSAASAIPGAQLYRACVNCHGAAGEGRPADTVPRIGGMPQWYLASQLKRFQEGLRGKHPDDADGLRMRAMSQQLMSAAEIDAVAEYVAAMPKVTNPSSHSGDTAAGQAVFVRCTPCHGAKGEGNQQLNAPPLAGLDDWYVERQLRKFRAGVRGKVPGDSIGPVMQGMSMTLAPDQIAPVAAYVHGLPR